MSNIHQAAADKYTEIIGEKIKAENELQEINFRAIALRGAIASYECEARVHYAKYVGQAAQEQ